MRVLAINEAVKAQAQAVVDFAVRPENHYKPFNGKDVELNIPGDDERYALRIPQGYRAVFSITEDREGKLWRHLSVSIPGGKYPHPFAVWTIADLFGFKGWDGRYEVPPKEWIVQPDDGAGERCIVVGTRYP